MLYVRGRLSGWFGFCHWGCYRNYYWRYWCCYWCWLWSGYTNARQRLSHIVHANHMAKRVHGSYRVIRLVLGSSDNFYIDIANTAKLADMSYYRTRDDTLANHQRLHKDDGGVVFLAYLKWDCPFDYGQVYHLALGLLHRFFNRA